MTTLVVAVPPLPSWLSHARVFTVGDSVSVDTHVGVVLGVNPCEDRGIWGQLGAHQVGEPLEVPVYDSYLDCAASVAVVFPSWDAVD